MARAGWYADPMTDAPLRWWDGSRWTEHTTGPPRYTGFDVAAPRSIDASPASTTEPTSAPPTVETAQWVNRILGDTDRFAVIDVETTGLYNADRVLEVAVVTLDRSGTVIDEFDTLVNPGRDVGPTWLHRISASMVTNAPLFEDVAHHVAARVDGAVCVAHNLPFDRRMMTNEFDRSGITVEWGTGLDTLSLTGCRLDVACAEHGIVFDHAHRALADARATASLLLAIADGFSQPATPAVARPLLVRPITVVTRDGASRVDAPEPYLADLARGVHASFDLAPYESLLSVALADLQLTTDERAELAAMAGELGLDDHDVARAHREFVDALIDEALDDHVLTDDEYDQLCRAAALLELDLALVSRRVDGYRTSVERLALQPDLGVCFTGDASEVIGPAMSRSDLEDLARSHGLEPERSVTKSRCGLVVATDPNSESSKARRARDFGIPIAALTAFLDALDSGEALEVARLDPRGVPLVCTDCGTSWVAGRRSKNPRCSDCRRGRAAA